MANLTSAKAKARDAKRISDLAQIQLTLELIFDKCNKYPSAVNDNVINDTQCTVNGINYSIGTFISKLPKDPSTNSPYAYYPQAGIYYDYRLGVQLETAGGPDSATEGSGIAFSSSCGVITNGAQFYCVSPR